MSQMKAVRLHDFGPPDNLRYEDATKPTLGSADLLIRVHAAGVNPLDAKIRSGHAQSRFPVNLPVILGWDVSGIVEAVGSDQSDFRPGDAVFSRPDVNRPGCYAEYVTVASSEVAKKPTTIDHVHAASVPLAACTAWQALFDKGGLTSGQTVLIHAAAGGVGSFAVQLARSVGAIVIGTGSAENRDYLESIGATQVIDYKNERFEDILSDVDLVLDSVGGDTYERSWDVLKPGGILVSLVSPTVTDDAAKRGMRGTIFMMQPSASQLSKIGTMIDQGQIKTYVEEVLPLQEASKAHEMIEKGHTRGKIVLKVDY